MTCVKGPLGVRVINYRQGSWRGRKRRPVEQKAKVGPPVQAKRQLFGQQSGIMHLEEILRSAGVATFVGSERGVLKGCRQGEGCLALSQASPAAKQIVSLTRQVRRAGRWVVQPGRHGKAPDRMCTGRKHPENIGKDYTASDSLRGVQARKRCCWRVASLELRSTGAAAADGVLHTLAAARAVEDARCKH